MTRLEQLRIDRFMSRADLAAETGLGIGTIRRLEQRLGGAQLGTLRKLVEFFGVPAGELLAEAAITPPSAEAA